eukprot:5016399-Pleurochrysis_carterae.AAC.1
MANNSTYRVGMYGIGSHLNTARLNVFKSISCMDSTIIGYVAAFSDDFSASMTSRYSTARIDLSRERWLAWLRTSQRTEMEAGMSGNNG